MSGTRWNPGSTGWPAPVTCLLRTSGVGSPTRLECGRAGGTGLRWAP
ncbi:Hypothetical protein AA314_05310 [Archangium gephyra]|uniref:Uncharacterized protein n=1 Tax=Archangium gephyra TaxID=48 RepID=A0AAC8QA37_9BACT|nr:Hypothetical protein AA314_05310 [Archangium gephyra]